MNAESNLMRLVIADSSPVKEMITFGMYVYIYIYFMVLHKSYTKLQQGQILYNMYPVVHAVPN
jgi:hypothetical protein